MVSGEVKEVKGGAKNREKIAGKKKGKLPTVYDYITPWRPESLCHNPDLNKEFRAAEKILNADISTVSK
jgi:hypothetical protein